MFSSFDPFFASLQAIARPKYYTRTLSRLAGNQAKLLRGGKKKQAENENHRHHQKPKCENAEAIPGFGMHIRSCLERNMMRYPLSIILVPLWTHLGPSTSPASSFTLTTPSQITGGALILPPASRDKVVAQCDEIAVMGPGQARDL